jgi:two-component SAPR family response regulator
LALLEAETPDAALLDENLDGRIVTPVAICLARKKIPFTIISGHVRSVSDEPLLSGAPRLQKPATKHQLAKAIADM